MHQSPEAAQRTDLSVAVVMLTFNQRDATLRALASFTPEERRSAHFVLWDNSSVDGTVEAVRERYPEVHVHWSDRNLGVASGRNAGAALALARFQPTHLLFLDNDLVMTPGFIGALADAFRANPQLGQAQAKLRSLQQPDRLNDGGGCRVSFWRGTTRPVGFDEVDRGQFDTPAPCVACGGAMMVRAAVFAELGGFDPIFDPTGPEDIDFSLRLQKRGYASLYVPRAMAYHEVSHTFGGGEYTPQYAHVKAQHWLTFLRRHGSIAEQLGFFTVGAPLIAVRMLVREARKGNLAAVTGSARGVLASMRRSRSTPSTQRR